MSALMSTFVAPPEWAAAADRFGDNDDVRVWTSSAASDPQWDEFLLNTSAGQFQQSSAWGRVKQLEDWRVARWIVTVGDQVTAGFQILWKTKLGVRFGYVSKGPVAVLLPGFGRDAIIALLSDAASRLRLQALIVQPGDRDHELAAALAATGYAPNHLLSLCSATVVVNLNKPFAEVERRFSHDVARQIRRHREKQVTTRSGGPEEAELFFTLMRQTCARQKVAPNPSTSEQVRAILREFQPREEQNPCARILFAEREGRTLAAFLLIRFGDRVSLWKKGVAADVGRDQPNRLLDWEAMHWAHGLGCELYDTVGIDRPAAERLIAGEPRATVKMKSSDCYKLDFGGTPELLPQGYVWTPRRVNRLALRIAQALHG